MTTNRILTAARIPYRGFLPKTALKPAFVAVPGVVLAGGPSSTQVSMYRWARELAVAEIATRSSSLRPLHRFELN